MRNLPEWAMAFWGAAAAGGVVVPLNAWWTSPELHYGLADSGTKVAFVDAARLDRLRAASRRAPRPAGRGGHPRGPHRGRRPSPRSPVPVISFAELVGDARAPRSPCPTWPSTPRTTPPSSTPRARRGQPKGAVGTHRNMGTNLMSLFFLNTRAGLRSPTERGPRDDDRGRRRAPTCCRCRCSTPPDVTRSWWRTPRPATSS